MKCIILAGGSGTRLWPLSRQQLPKQFLRLIDNASFLQKSVERALHVSAPEEVYVVTSKDHYHTVQKQLEEIDPALTPNIIVEPCAKNTAPAIAYAISEIKPSEEEIFFVSPSDHLISPIETFAAQLHEAAQLAQKGKIVTFGIHPSRPDTGFGYIKAKDTQVEAFVEKPTLEKAKSYLASGDYFWNAGMFIFSAKTFLQELKAHAPELSELKTPFAKLPSISFDYAVMEKSSQVAMLSLNVSWSDVGSWENVYDLLEKDASQNVIHGEVITEDTKNSLIYADHRLVATIGLDNICVIETDDAVLVAHKESSQQVKKIVHKLKDLGKKQSDEHLTTQRPWGSYTLLGENDRYKIKRICVNPLQKLSLQMHYHRSEHWVVVTGTAKVTINDQESIVHEGESIFVPKSSIHRVENPGKVGLEIIEVQVGEYLGEDDIVRFEDIYGRLKDQEAFNVLLSNRANR